VGLTPEQFREGIKPRRENRYGWTVRALLSELCPAEPGYFLAAITGGKDFSLSKAFSTKSKKSGKSPRKVEISVSEVVSIFKEKS